MCSPPTCLTSRASQARPAVVHSTPWASPDAQAGSDLWPLSHVTTLFCGLHFLSTLCLLLRLYILCCLITSCLKNQLRCACLVCLKSRHSYQSALHRCVWKMSGTNSCWEVQEEGGKTTVGWSSPGMASCWRIVRPFKGLRYVGICLLPPPSVSPLATHPRMRMVHENLRKVGHQQHTVILFFLLLILPFKNYFLCLEFSSLIFEWLVPFLT